MRQKRFGGKKPVKKGVREKLKIANCWAGSA